MTDAFSDNANFNGFLEALEPLKESHVVQKACIRFDKRGTEASAATGTHKL